MSKLRDEMRHDSTIDGNRDESGDGVVREAARAPSKGQQGGARGQKGRRVRVSRAA